MVKDHVEKRIPQSQQKHAHEGLMKCVKLHGKSLSIFIQSVNN